jgi:hypothetical protein
LWWGGGMTSEEQTVLLIRGMISQLPAAEREACEELVDHMKRAAKMAGEPVGTLAVALLGAEMQAETSK